MALWTRLDSQFCSHLIKCKVDKISSGLRNLQSHSLNIICTWKYLWICTALFCIHKHRLRGCLWLSSVNWKKMIRRTPSRTSSFAFHFLAPHYVWALNTDLKGTIPWMHQTKQQPLILNLPGAGEKKGFVRTNNGWIPKWAVKRNFLILVISPDSQLHFCWEILPGNILFNTMFCLYGSILIQFHSWRPIWRIAAPRVNH